jgi:hypothetical protein
MSREICYYAGDYDDSGRNDVRVPAVWPRMGEENFRASCSLSKV